jgi:hypothetical protein
MKQSKSIKTIAILLAPILLFFVLFFPYIWLDKTFLVDIFGCGCPKLDEAGNPLPNQFNTNDFTRLFWLFISVCVTAISAFLSKRIPKERWWLRIVYITGMIALSLLIASHFSRLLMWN